MRIDIANLTVAFGRRTIFDDAEFHFEPKSITALMGPSGAGKSTLLSVIAGYLKPPSGTVTLSNPAGRISWINQTNQLFLGRSAQDNVALGGISRGESMSVARMRALVILAELQMAQVAHTKTRNLSGGERQRVAIARALTAEAKLVLADEPTASLDAVSRRQVMTAFQSRLGREATVIIATHDQQAAEMCDRIIYLGN